MVDYIRDIFSSGSLGKIMIAVALAGAVASLTSCTIARLPVLLGLVSNRGKSQPREFHLALAFCGGLIITYTIFGFLFGLVAHLASGLIGISSYLYLTMGVLMLIGGAFFAGLIPHSIGWFNARCEQMVKGGRTVPSAFGFGIVFAFLEMPACACCGSVMLLIASMVAIKGSLIFSGVVFFSFAVGQSLPILILGFSAGLLKNVIPITQKLEGIVSFVVGNILMITGIFLILIS